MEGGVLVPSKHFIFWSFVLTVLVFGALQGWSVMEYASKNIKGFDKVLHATCSIAVAVIFLYVFPAFFRLDSYYSSRAALFIITTVVVLGVGALFEIGQYFEWVANKEPSLSDTVWDLISDFGGGSLAALYYIFLRS